MEKNVLVIQSLNPKENLIDFLDNYKTKIPENNKKIKVYKILNGLDEDLIETLKI